MPATVSNLRTKPITDIALAAEVFGSEPDVLMLQPAGFFRPWFCVRADVIAGSGVWQTDRTWRCADGDDHVAAGFHWDLNSRLDLGRSKP